MAGRTPACRLFRPPTWSISPSAKALAPNCRGGPQPDVLNFAWRDYGNRVGAWYMLDAFDALDLPMAALVNSAMYDYAPDLVRPVGRAATRSWPWTHQRGTPGPSRRV